MEHKKSYDDIQVSVIVVAYNHEKYIRQAINSFVTQITTFKYEVIIHDDASTDKTSEIIREYHKEYPDIIVPIIQTENRYQKGGFATLVDFIYPHIKGKYLAFCDCDDYWCDKNKLQMQYDIMKENPDVSLCTHRVQCINENGTLRNEVLPLKKNNLCINQTLSKDYIADEYFIRGINFQTSSFFIRKELFLSNEYTLLRTYLNGDSAVKGAALIYGKVYYIHKIMSCYRLNSSGSWSGLQKTIPVSERTELLLKMNEGLILLNKLSDDLFKDQIMQRVYKRLFYLTVRYGQYKNVKIFISRNSLSYKPKRLVSLYIYIQCYMLIYTPWLCRIVGVIYRAARKILHRS